jgi:hypothetical protein
MTGNSSIIYLGNPYKMNGDLISFKAKVGLAIGNLPLLIFYR